MKKGLEERFIGFTKTLKGAEFIDDLVLTAEQQAGQKADYFFENRQIISELKSLEVSAADKIRSILKPYENTLEWPHFYGEQELQKILNFLSASIHWLPQTVLYCVATSQEIGHRVLSLSRVLTHLLPL